MDVKTMLLNGYLKEEIYMAHGFMRPLDVARHATSS